MPSHLPASLRHNVLCKENAKGFTSFVSGAVLNLSVPVNTAE